MLFQLLVPIKILKLFPYFLFVKKITAVKGYKKKYFNKINVNQSIDRELDYGDANAQVEQINAHLLHNKD